jgi:hypothetical protein
LSDILPVPGFEIAKNFRSASSVSNKLSSKSFRALFLFLVSGRSIAF